jgi:RNA polymerase sigma-70 factor (ECF subfamily)
MSDPSPPLDRADAFRALYEAAYPDLLRFVQRRTNKNVAEDVVADAFLVVWRRFAEVPQNHDDARDGRLESPGTSC